MNAEIIKAKESLINTFKLAQQYGTAEMRNLDDYLKMAEELITIKELDKKCNEALSEAKSVTNIPDFENLYKMEFEKRRKKLRTKKTSEYNSFVHTLEEISSPNDEDLLVMQAELNVHDPITKKRLQNPLKNSICGHHYEEKIILETISKNKHYRCPVVGCRNNEFLKKEHLKIDHEMQQLLLASDSM